MRQLAFRGAARHAERPVRSMACLAFVALLAVAFWAGTLWIVQLFVTLNGKF